MVKRGDMNLIRVEFQMDRKRLILFVELKKRLGFEDFVQDVHRTCFAKMGLRGVRVFIQRRFVPKLALATNFVN